MRRATLEGHCNTLQHAATRCNTLQHTASRCHTLHLTATHCNTLQGSEQYPSRESLCDEQRLKGAGTEMEEGQWTFKTALLNASVHGYVAVCCSVLQFVAVCCSVVQCGAVCQWTFTTALLNASAHKYVYSG